MSAPSVLTIILNWRTAQMTLRSAEAAVAAMQGVTGEILIVDNDSGDGSFETLRDAVAARDWPQVSVLQSGHNGGYGAGNNFGIRAGFQTLKGQDPDYIYVLNSDAFPEVDSISNLVNYMENNEKTGMAGSLTCGEDAQLHQTAFRFPSLASEFEGAIKFGPVSRLLRRSIVALPTPEIATNVDWLAGASLLIRREVLEDIGLFDERFFLYFEETDLCRRAAISGWELAFVPESKITHIGSVSTGMKTHRRMPEYWFDSRLHYFVSNHGRAYALGATLAHLAGGAFARLRETLQRKPSSQPKFFLIDLAFHSAKAVLTGSVRKTRQVTDPKGRSV